MQMTTPRPLLLLVKATRMETEARSQQTNVEFDDVAPDRHDGDDARTSMYFHGAKITFPVPSFSPTPSLRSIEDALEPHRMFFYGSLHGFFLEVGFSLAKM